MDDDSKHFLELNHQKLEHLLRYWMEFEGKKVQEV